MASISEKRHNSRLVVDDAFSIEHRGSRCRVVDISSAGLGVTFIGGENWPEKLTLEFSLGPGSGRSGSISCRTVWESTMDFYKARTDEKVRRRGLLFMEPDSIAVAELHNHLKNLAESD